MDSFLLSLPFELRFNIWNLVLGPTTVEPCDCSTKSGICTISAPERSSRGFSVYEVFDNRVLRVCRQLHEEVRWVLSTAPKQYVLCNGPCLERFFLQIPVKDRRWINNVRVNLYIGAGREDTLDGRTGKELLQVAEASCGGFVQSALKCAGVGAVVDAMPVGDVGTDATGRRILCVDLTLQRSST
jgi:hypothetical protein